MNDAGQGGVAGLCRDHHLQGACFVDGAGKHRVSRGLVHWNALSRDWRLVDGAAPNGHRAVQRHALARPDPDDGVDGNLCSGHRFPAAVRLAYFGRLGREIQQALDGIACTVYRAAFDQFSNGIEGHHHGGFWPLANEKRAGHGHRHQRIDVQPSLQQGGKPLAVGGKARQPDGRRRQGHANALEGQRVWREEGHGFGADGQAQRQPHTPEFVGGGGPPRGFARCRSGCHGLRVEPCLANGRHGQRNHSIRGVNGQRACAELKPEAAHPGN